MKCRTSVVLLSIVIMFFHFNSRKSVAQARQVLWGDYVAVFYPEAYDPSHNVPSFALVNEPKETGILPADWKTQVVFGTLAGKTLAYIETEEGTDLYGTGEVTGSLRRNGTVRELWNTDNFGYEKYSGLRLYQSHPWVLAVRKDGSAYGVLADNTWKQRIILGNDITIESEGPAFRVIVIEGANPALVLEQLANLTGKMPMPPLWSLGYQQCRWSYYPDTRVKEIADTFRLKKIPCDVIWMDIHYMDGYRVFTFSEEHFPKPKELNNYLHERGFKSVWMIDPGVMKDENYAVYKTGTGLDVWVKDNSGKPYSGDVWPGPCVFPDFTQAKTRQWWGGLYKDYMATGIDGVWNDMNEPAVFNGPNWTMPEDNQHAGDSIYPAANHARYHNVYGMLMVKSSREGILQTIPDKRPFILTRSNFIGGHRYAATWTGDNVASWEHMKLGIPMVLNLGLSGQPFSGPDIGGFGDNATPELYGQWIATGVFYPFSRSHTATGTNNQEPWAFGKKIEAVSRTAIERRYRLLPYLYTLFYEASKTGMPVMRPVFFADFTDTKLRTEDQAFLLGGDLLISPKWAKDIKMPAGKWRSISLVGEDSKNDPYQPDILIRAGAIIPLGKVIQSTSQYAIDTLTLLVSPDENGKAAGKLYFDEGDGFAFQQGEYLLLEFSARKEGKNYLVEITDSGGELARPKMMVNIEVITEKSILKASGDGKSIIKASIK